MIEGFRRKRLPRLGKIGLGAKTISANSGREHPNDLNHFDVSECPEVSAVYGAEPTELVVMVPCVDIEEWFPVALKRYSGENRLLCRGDGQTASAFDEKAGGFAEVPCAYKDCPHFQQRNCQEIGNLMLILPEVNIMGAYQIDTSSWHGINRIYDAYETALERVTNVTGDPNMILQVHFRLARIPEVTTFTATDKSGNPVRKTSTHALLNLISPPLCEAEAMQLKAVAPRRQLTAGARVALPAAPQEFDDDDEDFGGVPEIDESQPTDLYPGAAPAAASLDQRATWAELLERAAEFGVDAAELESEIAGEYGAQAFADLSEEDAAEAIESLKAGVAAKLAGGQAGPVEGQTTAWAALLQAVAEAGKTPDLVAKAVLKDVGGGEFGALTEEQATAAIAKLTALIQNWQGGAKPAVPKAARAAKPAAGNGNNATTPAAAQSAQPSFEV